MFFLNSVKILFCFIVAYLDMSSCLLFVNTCGDTFICKYFFQIVKCCKDKPSCCGDMTWPLLTTYIANPHYSGKQQVCAWKRRKMFFLFFFKGQRLWYRSPVNISPTTSYIFIWALPPFLVGNNPYLESGKILWTRISSSSNAKISRRFGFRFRLRIEES